MDLILILVPDVYLEAVLVDKSENLDSWASRYKLQADIQHSSCNYLQNMPLNSNKQ